MFKIVVLFAVFEVTALNAAKLPHKVGIIGGNDASIEDFPYQLSLLEFGVYFLCGAALISPKFAVTAAQCTTDKLYISIGAGSTNATGGEIIRIISVNVHPKYDYLSGDYDVAVLELAHPVSIESAQPIPLLEGGTELEVGASALISGWGETVIYGGNSDVLQAAEVQIISHENCEKEYYGLATERMICAGIWEEGGIDSCRGDEGTPLVVDGKLAGLSSWDSNCGRPQKPAMYAYIGNEEINSFIRETAGI